MNFPGEKSGNYFILSDSAKLYYTEYGHGKPIVLIHGWPCSGLFFKRNVLALSEKHRVIVPDLRGFGNSGKTLDGHNICQYAKDLHELFCHLDLKNIHLAGWSMGGQIVLSYYDQFESAGRIASLALLDSDPYPFSQEEWNSHGLKERRWEGLDDMLQSYQADKITFLKGFGEKIFLHKNPTDDEREWILREMKKTPTWIGMASYSDFCISDYARILPDIKVPVAVFGCDSGVYPAGIRMAQLLAEKIPQGRDFPFTDGGHFFFYEASEKFNRTYSDFIRSI
jgi:Predicted hydrolases or acyltransferases (alpha/beta hydrolase superfamily)